MARQKKLPGVDEKDKPIEELEIACEVYRKAASASQRARQKTAVSRDSVISLMQKHGKEAYTAENGHIYQVSLGKPKIVMTEQTEGDEGDDGEGEGAQVE